MNKKQNKTLVLIDGHALVHRAYHALPPLTTGQGELVNAVYGFTSILLKVLKDLQPDYIAATFDLAGPTFRHKEFEGYKATRVKAPDELYAQIGRVKDVLAAFNIPVWEKEGYEADDVIGTIAKSINNVKLRGNHVALRNKQLTRPQRLSVALAGAAENNKKERIKTIIVTGDLDTLQLVDKDISVFTLKKGVKDTILYDEAAVRARFEGLGPEQMVDYKGLKGDPSDNIPGVPGVGEKTAIELLKQYGSLENLYKQIEKLETQNSPASSSEARRAKVKIKTKNSKLFEKLLEHKEQAFFSKYLATIKQDAPIKFKLKDAVTHDYDKGKVIKIFKDLGFYSLVTRLPSPAAPPASQASPPAKQGEAARARALRAGQVVGGQARLPGAAKSEVVEEEKPATKGLNDKKDVYEKIEQARAQGILPDKLYQLEKDLVPVIDAMEKTGIKIDVAYLKKLGQQVNKELAELEAKIYKAAGVEFNVNSPQQLSEVLFSKLNIATKGLKKTPGKVISTAAGELQKLKGQHPIIDLIIANRELTKLKTTYIEALPKLVAADGRLHTSFDALGTTTGRLSSKNPNLQNIPIRTELGNEIRKAFIAEKGCKLLAADYSQIELRVVAHIAKDKEMIQAFRENKDIHTITAAEVLEVSPDKITKEMRRMAKVLNFGVLYGMGAHGFAEAAGIDNSRAKEFIKKYFAEFSGVARYVEQTKKSAERQGWVQTMFGRRRFIPEINSSAWNLRQSAERMAVNMPIQGTAADIMKLAMVGVAKNQWLAANSKMLLQVHDELVFEVANDKVKEAAKEIKTIMENIYQLAVPLKVELEVGDNWGELKQLAINNVKLRGNHVALRNKQ